MNQSQLNKFKKIFEKEKQDLLYSHSIINEHFEIDRNELSDESDQTSIDMEQSMRIRLRNREALYLKKINQALKRIKDGTFGNCVDCDESIEERRLEARPTTTLCLTCKEEGEIKEKSFVGGSKSLGLKIKFRSA